MNAFIHAKHQQYPYTLREGEILKYYAPELGLVRFKAYSLKGQLLMEYKNKKLYVYHPYACDGCTAVPNFMQNEAAIKAAFFHDAGYQLNHNRERSGMSISRRQVDLTFKRLLPWYYRLTFYAAVRAAGWAFWNKKQHSLNIIKQ